MDKAKILLSKPLGEILQMANLISPYQIQIALMDQEQYYNTRIGEILALRGWLKQETVDFFADELPLILKNNIKKKIGEHFTSAGLLEDSQIKRVLLEQKQTGIKFGSISVLHGLIKQETLDFFLEYLYPEYQNDNIFSRRTQITKGEFDDDKTITKAKKFTDNSKVITKTTISKITSFDELEEAGLDDITWAD